MNNKMLGLGDMILEYHTHLHNVPLDTDSMKEWSEDEKFLRRRLNFAFSISEKRCEVFLDAIKHREN